MTHAEIAAAYDAALDSAEAAFYDGDLDAAGYEAACNAAAEAYDAAHDAAQI